jgi:hypothetical protein
MVACKFDQIPDPSRVPVTKVNRRPFKDFIHFFVGVVREQNRHVVFALRARLHGCANVRGQRAKSRRYKGVVSRARRDVQPPGDELFRWLQ